MPAEWISGVGGAVGAIGSSLINAWSVNKSNEANAELAREANQWSIDQWNRENAYNTPTAQMERLKAAGLNPNLVFSQGNMMNEAASSPSVTSAAGTQRPFQIDPLTAAQIANINANTEQTKAKTQQTNEETQQVKLDNFFKDFHKGIVEQNVDLIRQVAFRTLESQRIKSIDEVYRSLYSAAIVASFFDYDIEDVSYSFDGEEHPQTYEVGGYHYSQEIRDKFKELGVSSAEQTLLERSLYKTYVSAQMKVNARAGAEAEMNTVIPEMINDAPKWLQPILIVLNNWFNNGHMPSFQYSPNNSYHESSVLNTNHESFKNKIFNHN